MHWTCIVVCCRDILMPQKLEGCASQKSKPSPRCVPCQFLGLLNFCLFIKWFITSSHNLFKDLHTWKLKLQGSPYAVVPSTSINLLILSWFQLQVLGNHADGYGGYPLHHNTEIRKLTRHCEVTAILVLYGLPRWVIIHQLPISLHLYSSLLQTLHLATLVPYCVGREVVLTTT
jgi:hypothetical protein